MAAITFCMAHALQASLDDLLPTSEATHVAAVSGNWSSFSTWQGGNLPNSGAKVLIPSGITVTYDQGESVAVRLDWVRLDGKLQMSRTTDTYLLADTIAVMMGGEFEAGTEANPIPGNITSRAVIAVGQMEQLTGSVISNDAGSALALFDNDWSTQINTGSSTSKWYGLDFGSPKQLTGLRMDFSRGSTDGSDLIVEGANQADFSGAVELLRFNRWGENTPTRLAITDSGTYRYARVRIARSYAKCSELQFWTGDNRPIDTVADPGVLGRGLIAMGKLTMQGADKADWMALDTAPSMNDEVLVTSTQPVGWVPGDKILVPGTGQGSAVAYLNDVTRDEILTLTSVTQNGGQWEIRFTNDSLSGAGNDRLLFDHDHMPAGYDLKAYVANLSRNVGVETEGWQLGGIPHQQRGHVMVMHNDDFEIGNTGFYGLGRTDKVYLVTDPLETDSQFFNISTANTRGRYSFHSHRPNNQDLSLTAPQVRGCVVWDSPGWGFVNHDGYVDFTDCVSFDVVGAHFNTETGNEVGTFKRCLAVKSLGGPDGNEEGSGRAGKFDLGHNGNGFWIQGGGAITLEDCVASGAGDSGFYIWGDNSIGHPNVEPYTRESFPTALGDYYWTAYNGAPMPDELPVRRFYNNVAFNSKLGGSLNYLMWQKMSEQDTIRVPDYNTIEKLAVWGTYGLSGQDVSGGKGGAGFLVYYTGNTHFEDCLLLGFETDVVDPTTTTGKKSVGITANWAPMNLILTNTTIQGWDQGTVVMSTHKFSLSYRKGVTIIDGGEFQNRVNLTPSPTVFNTETETFDPQPPFGYAEIHNSPTFSVPSGESNTLPLPNFDATVVAGLGVRFDGGLSSDSDPATTLQPRIASFAWDFDNDGSFDAYGINPAHTFPQAGVYPVKLKVWDNMGATNELTKNVTVNATSYPNLIVDGDFSDPSRELHSSFGAVVVENGNVDHLRGWFQRAGNQPLVRDAVNEELQIVKNGWFGQVTLNEGLHRGLQDLSLTVRNTEGDASSNSLTVRVYGVDTTKTANAMGLTTPTVWEGKADALHVWLEGPRQRGVYPFSSSTLLASTELLAGSSAPGGESITIPDIDFGTSGFDYIVVHFRSNGIASSDSLSIDDITLGKSTGVNIALESGFAGLVNMTNHSGTSDFETNWGNFTQNQAGMGWFRSGSSKWAYDSANELIAADNSGSNTLAQALADGGNSTGVQTLRFTAGNSAGGGAELRVRVWGVNGNFTYSHWSGLSGGTLLNAGADVATGDFPSTQFIENVDLGAGYDYLILELYTTGVSSGELTVDDVELLVQ